MLQPIKQLFYHSYDALYDYTLECVSVHVRKHIYQTKRIALRAHPHQQRKEVVRKPKQQHKKSIYV